MVHIPSKKVHSTDPESRLAEVGLLDAEIGTLRADNRSLRAVNKVLEQDKKDLEIEIEKLQTITPPKSAKAKNSEHSSSINYLILL